jgi:hypothetical protein
MTWLRKRGTVKATPENVTLVPNDMEIAPGVWRHSGYIALEKRAMPIWTESSLMLGITALGDAGNLSPEEKDQVLLTLIATVEVVPKLLADLIGVQFESNAEARALIDGSRVPYEEA